jgi:hypothetical protein
LQGLDAPQVCCHDQVRVLDGGLREWQADKRPWPAEVASPAPALFKTTRRAAGPNPVLKDAGTPPQRYRNMTKAMDSRRGQGANRSDTSGYREDLQRRHRREDALSCFDISVAAYWELP